MRPLGRGGMSRVWEVRHPELPGRRLALKLASKAEPGSPARARFLRECELLARVRHPGVVAVHATGEGPEGPWLVMDLVEGETLEALLRRGPLHPARAAELVARIADGVAALHAAGLVHRDLKPQNVLLRQDGAPVVIDLGLARAGDAERLTRTGTMLGSPAWMAPEQVEGQSPERLDARVDVWGLGALLHAALGGEEPFAGARTLPELIQRIRLGEPGPVDAPAALQAVLRRSLAKRPEDRPADAAAFARELRRACAGAGGRRRTGALLAGGLGLALLVALAARSCAPAAAPPLTRPAASPGRPAEPVSSARPTPPVKPPTGPGRWARVLHPGEVGEAGAAFLPGEALRFLSWPVSLGQQRGDPAELVEWRVAPGEAPHQARRWEIPGPVDRVGLGGDRVVLLSRGQLVVLRLRQGRVQRWPLPPPPPGANLLVDLALSPDGEQLALVYRAPEATDDPAALLLLRLDEQRDDRVFSLRQREPTVVVFAPGPGRELLVGGELGVEQVPGEDLASSAHVVISIARDPAGHSWCGTRGWTIHALALQEGPAPLEGGPRLLHPALGGVGTSRELDVAAITDALSHDGPLFGLRAGVGPDGTPWLVSTSTDPPAARGQAEPRAAGGLRELRVWAPDAQGDWRNVAGVGAWSRPLRSLDATPDGRWVLVGHGGAIELWERAAIPTLGPGARGLPAWPEVVARLEAAR